jgi:hypothetical protein
MRESKTGGMSMLERCDGGEVAQFCRDVRKESRNETKLGIPLTSTGFLIAIEEAITLFSPSKKSPL